MLNDLKLTRRRILAAGSATAATLAATAFLAACGEADEDPDDNGGQGGSGATSTPGANPTATDTPPTPIFSTEGEAAVLNIAYEGGFMLPEDLVRRTPLVSLFNDGSLIYPGPIPEIFPQPAAPHLLVTTLSDKGVAAIGEKVLETGLFEDGDRDLDSSNVLIADAAHTVFTVRLAGQEPVRVSVYALDFEDEGSEMPDDEIEARRTLRDLLNYVSSAPTGFPTDYIAEQETQYTTERLQIITYPWDDTTLDLDFEPQALDWPLDEAPSALGEAFTFAGHDARCAVLDGDDLDAMLDALDEANILTRWEHPDESVYMINRPLLPGEEGCEGHAGSGGAPEPGAPIEHPDGAEELVLRYELKGGFVPLEYLVTSMPISSIYGDGSVFSQGPQIAIYPPPALPSINLERLTPEGIQMVLEEARVAGLLEGAQTWDEATNFVADAHTGVLTINANGEEHVVSVYAPGMFDIGDMVTDEEIAFRMQFDGFVGRLTALSEWLPENVFTDVEDDIPYDRLQIVAQPADSAPASDDVQPNELDWPLETPLSEMGAPHSLIQMGRCFVLDGQEFADVMSLMDEATSLTRWNSAGEQYVLLVRPLLPDEPGCQDPLQ